MDPSAAFLSQILDILRSNGFDINELENWWEVRQALINIMHNHAKSAYDHGYKVAETEVSQREYARALK